jgi:hypothetical protein
MLRGRSWGVVDCVVIRKEDRLLNTNEKKQKNGSNIKVNNNRRKKKYKRKWKLLPSSKHTTRKPFLKKK